MLLWWWSLGFLILAGIAGVLGFFVLQDRRRGFAKVIFYVFLMAAILMGIFAVAARTPPA